MAGGLFFIIFSAWLTTLSANQYLANNNFQDSVKLSHKDAVRLTRQFPLRLYYHLIKTSQDSARLFNFLARKDSGFKFEILDTVNVKYFPLNLHELIELSDAYTGVLHAMTQDSSWFTPENLKQLRKDTSTLSMYLRKGNYPPVNVDLSRKPIIIETVVDTSDRK